MVSLNRAIVVLVLFPFICVIFAFMLVIAIASTAWGSLRHGKDWECGSGIGFENQYDDE